MERRRFIGSCVALSSAGGLTALPALAEVAPRLYDRARLVDAQGSPLKTRSLVAETNYVFSYPFVGTPCFLLKLNRAAVVPATLKREDGATYMWQGGVGPDRTIVAFSAICAHKLAYPTPDVSFIRYQPQRSTTAEGHVIHCCADHSVYDPASGGRVVAGPAPQPLAAILLEYDAATDELSALGTVGAEQFGAFFQKYEFKLALDHGTAKAQRPVGSRAVVRELTQYCKQTIQC